MTDLDYIRTAARGAVMVGMKSHDATEAVIQALDHAGCFGPDDAFLAEYSQLLADRDALAAENERLKGVLAEATKRERREFEHTCKLERDLAAARARVAELEGEVEMLCGRAEGLDRAWAERGEIIARLKAENAQLQAILKAERGVHARQIEKEKQLRQQDTAGTALLLARHIETRDDRDRLRAELAEARADADHYRHMPLTDFMRHWERRNGREIRAELERLERIEGPGLAEVFAAPAPAPVTDEEVRG